MSERIYSVGRDVPYDLPDGDGLQWLVYEYYDEGYDGYGQAVALTTDGTVLIKDLSHCSCYGAFDCWETSCLKTTLEELLREKESVHDFNINQDIMVKIKQLISS